MRRVPASVLLLSAAACAIANALAAPPARTESRIGRTVFHGTGLDGGFFACAAHCRPDGRGLDGGRCTAAPENCSPSRQFVISETECQRYSAALTSLWSKGPNCRTENDCKVARAFFGDGCRNLEQGNPECGFKVHNCPLGDNWACVEGTCHPEHSQGWSNFFVTSNPRSPRDSQRDAGSR